MLEDFRIKRIGNISLDETALKHLLQCIGRGGTDLLKLWLIIYTNDEIDFMEAARELETDTNGLKRLIHRLKNRRLVKYDVSRNDSCYRISLKLPDRIQRKKVILSQTTPLYPLKSSINNNYNNNTLSTHSDRMAGENHAHGVRDSLRLIDSLLNKVTSKDKTVRNNAKKKLFELMFKKYTTIRKEFTGTDLPSNFRYMIKHNSLIKTAELCTSVGASIDDYIRWSARFYQKCFPEIAFPPVHIIASMKMFERYVNRTGAKLVGGEHVQRKLAKEGMKIGNDDATRIEEIVYAMGCNINPVIPEELLPGVKEMVKDDPRLMKKLRAIIASTVVKV